MGPTGNEDPLFKNKYAVSVLEEGGQKRDNDNQSIELGWKIVSKLQLFHAQS